MTTPEYIFIILQKLPEFFLLGQVDTAAVDTTDWRYRIGYTIGSWLPFLIIVALALFIILRSYRFGKEEEK